PRGADDRRGRREQRLSPCLRQRGDAVVDLRALGRGLAGRAALRGAAWRACGGAGAEAGERRDARRRAAALKRALPGAGTRIRRYLENASLAPKAMKTPPAIRSIALRTCFCRRRCPMGAVAAMSMVNQTSVRPTCMTARSRAKVATFTPSGTNCGRKVT